MKKQAYTMIAMAVFVGCLATSARAQCSVLKEIADIPFQFNVGAKTLPAGEYQFSCWDSGGKLLIRSVEGKSAATVLTVPDDANPQSDSKISFHRYGDRYFFVAAGFGGTMLDLPKTRAERAVISEWKASQLERGTVALTTRR